MKVAFLMLTEVAKILRLREMQWKVSHGVHPVTLTSDPVELWFLASRLITEAMEREALIRTRLAELPGSPCWRERMAQQLSLATAGHVLIARARRSNVRWSTLFRADRFRSVDHFVNSYEVGTVVTLPRLTATTPDLVVAEDYAAAFSEQGCRHPGLLVFMNAAGEAGLELNGAEVLLLPQSRWRIDRNDGRMAQMRPAGTNGDLAGRKGFDYEEQLVQSMR